MLTDLSYDIWVPDFEQYISLCKATRHATRYPLARQLYGSTKCRNGLCTLFK